MKAQLKLSSFLVVLSFFQGLESILVVKPQNTVVVTGNSAILNCYSNVNSSSISWLFGGNVIVWRCVVDPSFDGQYVVVNRSEGQCDLVVKKVIPSLCGVYSCFDGQPPYGFAIAFLTQVDSDPYCQPQNINYITEGGLVPMSCSVDFVNVNPSMTPYMTWSGAGCGLSTQMNNSSFVVSSINVTAQLPILSTCTCTTRFNAPLQSSDLISTIAPTYSYVWTSPSNVHVYCSSSNTAAIVLGLLLGVLIIVNVGQSVYIMMRQRTVTVDGKKSLQRTDDPVNSPEHSQQDPAPYVNLGTPVHEQLQQDNRDPPKNVIYQQLSADASANYSTANWGKI